jgi:hypothetical protein
MVIMIEDDYTYEVTCEYEPAQNGGMDDPSWPAHLEIETVELVLDVNGHEVRVDVTEKVDMDTIHDLAWKAYLDDY